MVLIPRLEPPLAFIGFGIKKDSRRTHCKAKRGTWQREKAAGIVSSGLLQFMAPTVDTLRNFFLSQPQK